MQKHYFQPKKHSARAATPTMKHGHGGHFSKVSDLRATIDDLERMPASRDLIADEVNLNVLLTNNR